MHELSIALSIVDAAVEEAGRLGAVRVTQVHLKLGEMAGVVKEALLASYQMASLDSTVAGSELIIEEVPVAIFCRTCQGRQGVVSPQEMRCRACGTFSSEIVAGRELEVVAMEIDP
jgi:hydrogenase nickel incorporation protein HypA/HybF